VDKCLDNLYAAVYITDMKNTTTTKTIKCDSNFPQCKRNAKVTFPKTAFTSELHLCRRHADKFQAEAIAFYGRNA
jgi:hypothetical protein